MLHPLPPEETAVAPPLAPGFLDEDFVDEEEDGGSCSARSSLSFLAHSSLNMEFFLTR